MDVSDGLAWDLFRLARASGVRARLLEVPIHRDARRAASGGRRGALWHALHDGEDHELIAVMAAADARRALEDGSPELANVSMIGRMERGEGLVLGAALAGGEERDWHPKEGGWRHGR
jgi:thiamine monophosphate kinase